MDLYILSCKHRFCKQAVHPGRSSVVKGEVTAPSRPVYRVTRNLTKTIYGCLRRFENSFAND